jgi:hypothetical protein
MFEEDDQPSVNFTIGQLLADRSGRLKEVDGMLHLGPKAGPGNATKSTPSARPTVTTRPASAVPSVQSKPAPVTNAIPARYIEYEAEFEEPIDLPNIMNERDLDVVFKFRLYVHHAKRIGIATDKRKDAIIWIPIGGSILCAEIGEYRPNRNMELMGGNYLAVVVFGKDGPMVRYYRSPTKERFALSWHDDEDEV